MISFDSSTVYGFAGMTEEELKALLNTGYTAWNNVEKDSWPKVSIDTSEIDTAAAGAYKAYYTVTDEAGNRHHRSEVYPHSGKRHALP